MAQYETDMNDQRVYPLGLTRVRGGIHLAVAAEAKEVALLLYERAAGKERAADASVRVPFPEQGRNGSVWEMTLTGKLLDRFEYAFEADGRVFPDPYGRSFTGREEWGNLKNPQTPLRTPVRKRPFDWEGDAPLCIPYEDCIVYRAHVRGFTCHHSSGVPGKGTFRGIRAKIPYLKELGITTLELLPVAEFSEVMMPDSPDGRPCGKPEPTGKINYWGYASALAFAPKASYAGKQCDPEYEMKQLVKELHRAGMELVLEMFFSGKESPSYVLDAVRYWVREYHIDGVHITGQADTELLARDPYLAFVKLWGPHWNAGHVSGAKRLGEYNEGFQNDMRRVLKGDDDQMRTLMYRLRENPSGCARLNFMAGTNGFTLADMVSYEQKHNEENGEKNQDGTDYNYTWNCGEEGPTRKKKIRELRKRQLRNALVLSFLSQGVPVLLAGDEFGNSQMGNNNAYCQDNATSWLNWSQLKTNGELFWFVKALIRFRKSHPVFHQSRELRGMDYLACGHPDISFHGSCAWVPELTASSHELGILYSGAYGKHPDGSLDTSFYVACNLHWEPHALALPNLPRPLSWHAVFDTGRAACTEDGSFEEGGELPEQRTVLVSPRTICVLAGLPGTKNPELPAKTPRARRKGAAGSGKQLDKQ